MTKLDTIEATFNGLIETHRYEDAEEYAGEKFPLFIRAVRQLGREYMAWYSSRPDLAVERVEPDVMELLEKS